MSNAYKNRDYLFDNYKTLLILLVVIGHFIEPCYDNNWLLTGLKWLIVSFHMPAFIFISGYFSKKDLPITVLIKKLLIPYVVYEVIYYLFYTYVIQKETELYLLYPKFSLWYLLALFVWRLATPYIRKVPHHFLLSVIAGLIIGCTHLPSNYLSIPRILVFYPFFLAGMYCDRDTITKLRNRRNQWLALGGALLCFAIVMLGFADEYSIKIFYGRYNYDFLDQTILEGILCRVLCYVIGFALTLALLFLISEKQNFLSYIGTRTMAIYLFHGLVYNFLKDCTHLLDNVNTIEESIFLIVNCIVISLLFSPQLFTNFTNKVANLF